MNDDEKKFLHDIANPLGSAFLIVAITMESTKEDMLPPFQRIHRSLEVVITDINMPKGNGVELLDRI